MWKVSVAFDANNVFNSASSDNILNALLRKIPHYLFQIVCSYLQNRKLFLDTANTKMESRNSSRIYKKYFFVGWTVWWTID